MSYRTANGWIIDEAALTEALDVALTSAGITTQAALDAFVVSAFSAANSPGMGAQARATCIAVFRNLLKKQA